MEKKTYTLYNSFFNDKKIKAKKEKIKEFEVDNIRFCYFDEGLYILNDDIGVILAYIAPAELKKQLSYEGFRYQLVKEYVQRNLETLRNCRAFKNRYAALHRIYAHYFYRKPDFSAYSEMHISI